ncbi:MAG TPA: hypothetical protein VFZ09_42830 [Archangium sp.]|uniref:hypothetical protein n=1 Tax=Archangium sp. TaxID=1872627 RepID=UPI002E327941|nr:hypothetical protein [Archangium sp.]HEX5753014.1 hypothetical protein [Archangium sp.]
MKMQRVVLSLVSLMAACGGVVEQEPVPASVEEALVLGGTACGPNVCGTGTYCCNASCGVCAAKGASCLDVMCETSAQPEVKAEAKQAEPASIAISSGGPCGSNYCGKGYFCCNPGCGVCAPDGGGCPDVMCD